MRATSEFSLNQKLADLSSEPGNIFFDLPSYKDKNYLTHNFHPYPAKFVPQIPRKVILDFSSKGEVILDPFCGSGTSLVEAGLLGRTAIGFDISPLACLISKVKTTPLTNQDLKRANEMLACFENLLFQIKSKGFSSIKDCDPPEFMNRNHWFKPVIQYELAAIKSLIWKLPSDRLQDFFKVAFSAIIVKVSNQDSETRWVAVEKDISLGDAVSSFIRKSRDMLQRLQQFGQLCSVKAKVLTHSALEPFPLEDASTDMVITSPPYMNSFDYYLYHKLRYFWLDWDHHFVQERELGSRNRHSDKGEGIETYLAGMSMAIGEIFRVLRKKGMFCIVIGDSILKNELVDMKKTYVPLCQKFGFQYSYTFSFDQRKYSASFTRGLKTISKQGHILLFSRS